MLVQNNCLQAADTIFIKIPLIMLASNDQYADYATNY